MLKLPLVLLVDQNSAIVSAADLWTAKEIAHPLVCPPATETIGQVFRRGLKLGDITWPARLIVDSIESVAAFVAGTNVIGVSLGDLESHSPPSVRELPLAGFDPVQITALWLPANASRLKKIVAIL